METSPRHQENLPIPSLLPSPNGSTSSSTSSTSPRINHNHNHNHHPHPLPPQSPHQHRPITRSESANPYPTTFVQADTSSFKQVVQMLTGSSKPITPTQQPDLSPKTHIPPIKSIPKKPQQSGFKLYERRNSLKNLKINPLNPIFNPNNHGFSPRKPEILSPSILDLPALVLSPVTPLIPDPFDRSGSSKYHSQNSKSSGFNEDAEEKAIKEKGFYLHPSPATTPRETEPRLLPLFPVTSPRVSGSSTSSGSS
ncbi:VQ domain-containing protein [Cephalotus follicularis]|uniref:VQ domain-containing protein n=1 Tax=Cephalotus follicularis TaxID=3775 RepID=A0A1Q3BFR0_CEPFO|nr:VQ domain-containing protein [Cephalotus follicularis]